MDLGQLFPFILFLHVMGAIIAFGPTFAFSIMGAMAGREPQHANFSARQSQAIANRLVIPLAIFQGITGVLLIMSGKIDLMSRLWLQISIILYIIALTYSITIQRSAVAKLIALTSTPPAPGAGPSPEIPPLVRRIQLGGMFTGTLIVIIVFLMVVKPTF